MFLASCAEPAPEVVTPPPEPKVSEGKPVKIPVGTVEKGKYTGMAMDEFFVLQQSGGALIYDVRVPYFFNIDHIPGAVNWPHTKYGEQIQQRDLEIEKARNAGKKVVLYCFNLGCPEARNVAKKLTRRGYNLSVFSSGIDTWREAGLPME
jgi:rhodanese-related sulfurtransferase